MPKLVSYLIFILILFLATGCLPQEAATPVPTLASPSQTQTEKIMPSLTPEVIAMPPNQEAQFADVLSVRVTGNPGAYQFSVEVASPDTGCQQYADWWEVFNEEGQLLYRRILLHSHVSEQPFTRSGGPVDIAAEDAVYVRAHMNTVGYGGLLMTGSVQDGFMPVEVEAGFGSGLERVPPQPEDCAF